jgi:4'-phosphopantetheinyl transferase
VGEPLSLWWAALDGVASAPLAPELMAALSPEEKRRADRLKRPLDGMRFRAARGWLRHLLATELGCKPVEVTFATGEGGKPRVVGSELHFSAARSEDVALYAVSWRTEVGVDLEAIRTTADVDAVARRFFSAEELRALAALAPDRRTRAIYECWTRKEAYVKGTGQGLSVDLRDLEVLPGHDGVTRVGGWAIHQLDFSAGFAAAVAGRGLAGWRPAIRQLTGAGPAPPR